MIKNREKICEVLCGRKKCPEDINICDGRKRTRCQEIERSFINGLNENQIKYIMSSLDDDIFLKACPGSGKTEVLGIKCAYEINLWRKAHQGLAILTFTNSAEKEIRNRAESYLDENLKYPHYLGTFTSWIHGYVANPFLSKITQYKGDENKDKSIRLVDSDSNSSFLNIFSSKYGYLELGKIKAHEYFRDFKTDEYIYCGSRSRNGQSVLKQLLDKDNWRNNDLGTLKSRFWKRGFYLYEDVEYLVYFLLSKYEIIAKLLSQRFPSILIDECQDLSYVQLEIIRLLYEKGCKIHLIGDLDQAIYNFRNIEPRDTLDFIKKFKFKELQLNRNYRSCQPIVDISDLIINRNSSIVGCNKVKVEDSLVALLYKKDKEREAVKRFHKLVINSDLLMENSRIIVRNNNLKNKLLGLNKQVTSSNNLEDTAKAIYLAIKGENISEFKSSFILLAKSIQKMYFKESEHLHSNYFYKPAELEMSEWKKLLSKVKSILSKETLLLDFTKTWSEWKKILNKIMKESISILRILKEQELNLGSIRSGNSAKTVEEVLFINTNSMQEYKIETIHGCKGMSLDAVLFMSSYQAGNGEESGAYWRQWFDRTVIEEKNRLAYVAFSRAKYMLALGIPKSSTFKDEDKKFLVECGFKVIDV